MILKVTDGMEIVIDDDKIASWSYDERLRIATVNMTDGTCWKYEIKEHRLYEI